MRAGVWPAGCTSEGRRGGGVIMAIISTLDCLTPSTLGSCPERHRAEDLSGIELKRSACALSATRLNALLFRVIFNETTFFTDCLRPMYKTTRG